MNTMRALHRRVMTYLYCHDTELLELFTAWAAVLWGVWLIIFNPFEYKLYEAFRQLAPAWVWGMVLLMVGASQNVALATDNTSARRRAAFVGFLCWCFVSVMYALTDVRVTPVIINALLAAGTAWCYARLPNDSHGTTGSV